MSRIGKKVITLPDKVKVSEEKGMVFVEGPLGKLETPMFENLELQQEANVLTVLPKDDAKDTRAKHGLLRSLLSNMVIGVSQGYERRLEVRGVGYRVEETGKYIVFHLGYSHPILFEAPKGVEVKPEQIRSKEIASIVVVKGIDKEIVGQVAAYIRSFRKPEPYKGKGIRYQGEYIRRKAGKAGAK